MKIFACVLVIFGTIIVSIASLIALILGGPLWVLITLIEAAVAAAIVYGLIALIKKICE